MEPSRRPPLVVDPILYGRVVGFSPTQGIGFVASDDKRRYVFHIREGRKMVIDGSIIRFRMTRENRIPQTGDRIIFKVASTKEIGKTPKTSVWAFETEPRATTLSGMRSLSIVQDLPIAARHERLDVILERQSDGIIGVTMGLTLLRECLPEPAVRVFCEVALKGEALWLDFKAQRKRSGDEDYGWESYAKSILMENRSKIIGPKDCLLEPADIRFLRWTEALDKAGIGQGLEIFELHFGDEALVAKYASACEGCSMSDCKFFPLPPLY